jgi:hypothetical protein
MTRQDILDTIRSTAEANGGIPLGEDRLAQIGLTSAVWGRYWPRLSAAQREAGLTPNKANSAYPDDEALRLLGVLAQDLGTFPTSRELSIKRRQDPSFPSHRVFRRLGSSVQLRSRLREYAQRVGDDDLVSLCGAATPHVVSASKSTVSFGTVYLLKGPGKRYKIGRTNAFGRRQRELSIQLPFETRKIHIIETDDPEGVESYWHNRFDSKRINSEWFQLEPNDVAAFKRWKKLS